MSRANRAKLVAGIAFAIVLVAMVTGCSKPKEAALQAKVGPPAIKQAGTLRVGVDLSYPPFAGTDSGQQAGIDIDVASALAQRLGVTLAIVDVKASDAATALAGGRVDTVMSVPFADAALSNLTLAGSYISDGVGLFVATEGTASIEPTMTEKTLPPLPEKIGAQKSSPGYWHLVQNLGPESVRAYPTLRDAFAALNRGDVAVVAGDAIVGAYIGRDFPNIHYAGQLGDGSLLGVAVAPNNTKLADATRAALDGLATDGVLDAIRLKWVGNLAKPKVSASASASETTDPARP